MNYQILVCHVSQIDLELISDFFFKHNCLGTTINEKPNVNLNHYGEIYTLDNKSYPIKGVIVTAYFYEIDFLPQFNAFIKHNKLKLLSKYFVEDYHDKQEDYKEFSEIKINNSLSIITPRHKVHDDNRNYIIIEPGLGFGTGHHITTQQAIRGLLKYLDKVDTMLDFGCGSGILAIIGKKYGINTVYALDCDSSALKNAIYNAKLNNAEIIYSNIPISKFEHEVSLIVANITYEILKENLLNIKRILINHGIIIFSGILACQKEMIISDLEANDFTIIETKSENNWEYILHSQFF